MWTNNIECFPSAVGKVKYQRKMLAASGMEGCNVDGVKISYNNSL